MKFRVTIIPFPNICIYDTWARSWMYGNIYNYVYTARCKGFTTIPRGQVYRVVKCFFNNSVGNVLVSKHRTSPSNYRSSCLPHNFAFTTSAGSQVVDGMPSSMRKCLIHLRPNIKCGVGTAHILYPFQLKYYMMPKVASV